MAEAISLAKELNDMHGVSRSPVSCRGFSATLSANPAEVERLASDLIELSTRHNFAHLAGCRQMSSRLGAQRFR